MKIYKRKKIKEQEIWAQPILNEDIEKRCPNIECVSLCGDMVISTEDKKIYYSIAAEMLNQLFKETNYKFYMLVRLTMRNPNSKVENYLKIWKSLNFIEKKAFNLGVEIKIDEKECSYYCGVIEFVENDFHNIIELSKKHRSSMMFWTKKFDINDEEHIRDIAQLLYGEKSYTVEKYQRLSGVFCLEKQYGILKILNDSTGIDINIIFNKELIEFAKVSEKWLNTKIDESI